MNKSHKTEPLIHKVGVTPSDDPVLCRDGRISVDLFYPAHSAHTSCGEHSQTVGDINKSNKTYPLNVGVALCDELILGRIGWISADFSYPVRLAHISYGEHGQTVGDMSESDKTYYPEVGAALFEESILSRIGRISGECRRWTMR